MTTATTTPAILSARTVTRFAGEVDRDGKQRASSADHSDAQGGGSFLTSPMSYLPTELTSQLPLLPNPLTLANNLPNWRQPSLRMPTMEELRKQSVDDYYQQLNLAATAAGFFQTTAPIGAYGGPLLSTAYAGFNVYKTAKDTYNKNKDLDPDQRLQQTLKKTGEVALFHLLATVLIPMLVGTAIFNRLKNRIVSEKIPKFTRFMSKRPMLYAGLMVFGIMVALGGVINRGTRLLLDWTYRPLVRNKKPEGWDKVREKLQQGIDRLDEWNDRMSDWITKKTGIRLTPVPYERPLARADWPSDMAPLKRPARFDSFFV